LGPATHREPSARLHAIVDVEASTRAGFRALDVARAFLAGGARFLQIRAKTLGSRAFLDLADACVAAARSCEATVIINDRVDIARLSGAAGVHVGQDDVAPAAVRRLLDDAAIVGLSTHTIPQIETSLNEPISYLAIGPVFGSATKETGYDAVGLTRVQEAVRRAGPLPVVAIGGITLENASSVIDAGAASIAVIGDLLTGADPERRTRAFLQRLAENRL
jgi:thiamine-phosphate pyrophosphorylase